MPFLFIEYSKPRLLITVATIVLFFNVPCSIISIAQIPIILSPSTILPFSSEKTTLSASPSKDIPTSAPCSKTAFAIFSGYTAPQLSLIFVPFGSTLVKISSAPSSLKASGAALYDAPFAQSTTILSPFKSIFLGNVFFTNSTYLPIPSILYALPIEYGSNAGSLLSIILSISCSVISASL